MIIERVGNIFEQQGLDFIIHQCNLFHNFGKGIAAQIAAKYPWAEKADREHGAKGDLNRLGTYEIVHWTKMLGGVPGIVNAYCQDGLSATKRVTNYAAMGKIFFDLERQLTIEYNPGDNPTILGIPHGIGCGLANGEWYIVRELIGSAFAKSSIEVVIVKLP